MSVAFKTCCKLRCTTPVALAVLCGGSHAVYAAQQPGASEIMCTSVTGHNPQAANAHTMDESDYPLLSWMQGEQGNVVLDVLVSVDGSVADTQVARSSGFARLDGAAADIVRMRWRYKPVVSGDHAIACHAEVMVSWRLDTDPAQLAASGPFTIVQMKAADYPPGGLARQERGTSIVMMLVDTDGKVLQCFISKPSGYRDLDTAAMDAATHRKWTITPARLDGNPVKALVGLIVVWSPDDK